jgi:hypothetical protein
MNWISHGNRHISPPYHLHSTVRGWECWYSTDAKYTILARELPSLAKAKEFAASHAKQVTA